MSAATAVPATAQITDPSGPSFDPATAVAADFIRFSARVEGVVRASTRDADTAADATQEAFVRLLREARAGRYPENVQAWLYRTAMNIVISGRRRAAVAGRKAPELLRLDAPPSPDVLVVERERTRSTQAALAGLRPTSRAAVILAAQGVPGPEIAMRLGRSHGATRALLCRARGQLRTALAEPVVA